MNGRDPWHFLKELKTLKDSGVGEPKGVNLVQDVETKEQKALRLGVNWLAKTALGKKRELPQDVTAAEAAAMIKTVPDAPYLPAGTVKSQVDRMRVGVVTQGAVGSRFTVGGLPIAGGRQHPKKSMSQHKVALQKETGAFAVPAMTLPTLRAAATPGAQHAHKQRVDPIASLVRTMKSQNAGLSLQQ